MNNDSHISDNRLHGFLKKFIRLYASKELKGIMLCGSTTHANTEQRGSFIIANNVEAKLTNTLHCHSVWACPHCMSKEMAKKGEKIGAAIDALAKYYNEFACHVTFTIPHHANMTHNDAYTILRTAWRKFNKTICKGGIVKRKYTLKTDKIGEAGTEKIYTRHYFDAFRAFRDDLQSKHMVRAYDATWGENSWHPHIHALFWVPDHLFSKIKDYEEPLFEKWWKCARAATLQYYTKKFKTENIEVDPVTYTDNIYTEWRKYPKGEHRSLHISKDRNGNIRKEGSARYIAGWGGNMELTAEYRKKAKPGHYSPMQLLEKAYRLYYYDKKLDEALKFINIFLEYAKDTRGHRRVEFSNTGIRDIIRQHMKSDRFIAQQKKRLMDKEAAHGAFQIIHWLKKEQLYCLSHLTMTTEDDPITTILEIAKAKCFTVMERRRLIEDYLLLNCKLDISENKPPTAAISAIRGTGLNVSVESYLGA